MTELDSNLENLFKTLKNVDKFEILPYHTMGEFKWRELGIPYPLEGVKPPTADRSKMPKLLCTLKRIKSIKIVSVLKPWIKKEALDKGFLTLLLFKEQ